MKIKEDGFKINKTFVNVTLYVIGSALLAYAGYLDSGLPCVLAIAGTMVLILAFCLTMPKL